MTLEEKLEKFKSGTTALHTPTQETFDKLMEELEKRGYKWCTGSSPTNSPSNRWGNFRTNTCVSYDSDGMHHYTCGFYRSHGFCILEITEDDFTAPPETVEYVMKSIEEIKADLESYHKLFKKYGVVITGNLEPAMRAKLESLLKKRVVS